MANKSGKKKGASARTKVKDLNKSKQLTSKDMKKVKGGAINSNSLTFKIKGE